MDPLAFHFAHFTTHILIYNHFLAQNENEKELKLLLGGFRAFESLKQLILVNK